MKEIILNRQTKGPFWFWLSYHLDLENSTLRSLICEMKYLRGMLSKALSFLVFDFTSVSVGDTHCK